MNASELPKGQSPEEHSDGRPKCLPGIYVHKELKSKFITAPGEEGTIQADYLMKPFWNGMWEWTGDVPTRQELLEMHKKLAKEEAIIEAPLPKGGENYVPELVSK